MSDILSTRKIGDNSGIRPQVAGAATAATGTVANLPTTLNNASVGTLIKALVTAQNGRGLATLETDKGTLTLQTNLALKVGSEVVLQLQSTGTQNRFLILSVDHQPLSSNAPKDATGGPLASGNSHKSGANVGGTRPEALPAGANPDSSPRAVDARSGNPQISKIVGNAARAATTVMRTGDGGFDIHGPLTAGLVVPARVIATARPGQPTAQATTAAGTTAGTVRFAIGDVLILRILAIAPAGLDTLAPSVPIANQADPVMHGTFTRTVAGGRSDHARGTPASPSEISLPEGRITISVTPPPKSGSRILLEVLDVLHKFAPASRDGVDSYLDFLRLGADWRALKDTIGLLLHAGAPATGMQATPLVAESGARMASTMLFFMAALKSGDVRTWLGDSRADQLLQSGHGTLLGQLSDDFSLMSRHAGDAQATGWHALAVPVDTGTRVEQFRLFYRRRNSSSTPDDNASATHFVVEADLSRIGLFRLEGLVRPHQFDLAVHSARDLGNNLRDGIRSIFQDALNSGDLAGTIRFDAGPSAPFNPMGQSSADVGHAAAVIV